MSDTKVFLSLKGDIFSMLEVGWQLLFSLQANFRLEDGNGSIHVLLIVNVKMEILCLNLFSKFLSRGRVFISLASL